MGLFSNRRSASSTNNQATHPKEKTDEEKAFDYFDTEEIRCDFEIDKDTVTFIYKSLKVKNGDTSDAMDMKEGLQTLDNNVYHFARAVFIKTLCSCERSMRYLIVSVYWKKRQINNRSLCTPLWHLPP